MDPRLHARHPLTATALLAALLLTGCSATSSDSDAHDGDGMMGGSSTYRSSSLTCTAPTSLPGTRVTVTLGDMGMTTMMEGVAPMGARMRLQASTTQVPAGRISLVVSNLGWRTHELVVLPLAEGAGHREVGSDGRVSETGSLGEASRSCGPGAGEGIPSGSAGWVTMTLKPGRYELVCNLRNHYGNGMHQAFVVS
jgi:uncharacterized cupredoxin-like copper-binding protein